MELGFEDVGGSSRSSVPPEVESIVVKITARDGNEAIQTMRLEGEELAGSRLRLEDLRLPVARDYMVRVESHGRSKTMTRDFERLVRLESGLNHLKVDLIPIESYRSAVFYQVPYILLSDEIWQAIGPLRESLNGDGFLHQDGRLYFPPVPCRFWTLDCGGNISQTDATGRVRIPVDALRNHRESTLLEPSGILQARLNNSSLGKGRSCEVAYVLPYLFRPESDSAIQVEEGQLAGPNRQNTSMAPRGSYPAAFEGECRGSTQNFLNSPCFQRRRSGECSLEDLRTDYAALASYPSGIPIDFLGWSQHNFLSGSRFINLVPIVKKSEKLSCRAYHLGRDCTQTTAGDISLELFSQIWFPDDSFPVVQVRAGDSVQLTLHNNGSSGVTYLQAESSEIGGLLSYRYPDRADSRSTLPFADSISIPIRHGVQSGEGYTYNPDLLLTYEVPQTATPRSEDFLVFWADHRRVPVKIRVKA